MRSLFLVVGFYSVLIAIVFSQDNFVGLCLITFLSLILLPPFVLVGLFTTKGFRRAFFIGAAIGGLPHFIATTYYLSMIGASFDSFEAGNWFESDETCGYMLIAHLIGIGLGTAGGLSGLFSFGLLHGFASNNSTESDRN